MAPYPSLLPREAGAGLNGAVLPHLPPWGY